MKNNCREKLDEDCLGKMLVKLWEGLIVPFLRRMGNQILPTTATLAARVNALAAGV